MAIEKISIQQIQELADRYPVLDVRSPGEYGYAHIPGAYNLPLFSDEERKVVGTVYKKQSKQIAIKTGLQFFGVKMVRIIEEAENIIKNHSVEASKHKSVIVHCWRGGMRSAGVAWLLDLYGFKVYVLIGGYKSFRRWCNAAFANDYSFRVVGGYTGSGKTKVLKELACKAASVIDLEALAHHKGSAFGHLGEQTQPTQEMFENKLAMTLATVEKENSIWIEDESQRIGTVSIPNVLYAHLQTMPVYFLEIPFEERLKYLVHNYGTFEKENLAESILRITKRLGGLETKTALEHLEAGDLFNCFKILLKYYDKHYLKCLEQKKDKVSFIKNIPLENTDAVSNADVLLTFENKQEIKVANQLVIK